MNYFKDYCEPVPAPILKKTLPLHSNIYLAENSLKLENKHSLFELEYILLDNNNRMLLKNGRNYSDPDLFE